MHAGSDDPAYLTRTFEETMALLDEARRLFERVQGRKPTDAYAGLRFHCEAMRVTCRLTQSMAWLLAQKAVHNGEIDAERMASAPEFRIGARTVCEDDRYHHDPVLPPWMRDLRVRSHAIYQRVIRLDEQIQECAQGQVDPRNRFPTYGPL